MIAAADGWKEYYELDSFGVLSDIVPPIYLDSLNGIGKIFTGQPATADEPERTIRGFVRGSGGIYSLDLSRSPFDADEAIGFRCAR